MRNININTVFCFNEIRAEASTVCRTERIESIFCIKTEKENSSRKIFVCRLFPSSLLSHFQHEFQWKSFQKHSQQSTRDIYVRVFFHLISLSVSSLSEGKYLDPNDSRFPISLSISKAN
jgi:hypothetical protein